LQRLDFFYADPAAIWVGFDDLDHGRHVLNYRLGVRTPIRIAVPEGRLLDELVLDMHFGG